jgi:hypothetical protein
MLASFGGKISRSGCVPALAKNCGEYFPYNNVSLPAEFASNGCSREARLVQPPAAMDPPGGALCDLRSVPHCPAGH